MVAAVLFWLTNLSILMCPTGTISRLTDFFLNQVVDVIKMTEFSAVLKKKSLTNTHITYCFKVEEVYHD